jgi:hypothetical protein
MEDTEGTEVFEIGRLVCGGVRGILYRDTACFDRERRQTRASPQLRGSPVTIKPPTKTARGQSTLSKNLRVLRASHPHRRLMAWSADFARG